MNLSLKSICLIVILLEIIFVFTSCSKSENFSEYKDGDIIFQTSASSQSKAIQLATNSKYSHMGIIYKQNGKYFVFEAVQPVKITPLSEWIKRGVNKHYVVKRLINADDILTQSNLSKMKKIGNDMLNKSYDIEFNWSDSKMYCSELVWKIYYRGAGVKIGDLKKLSDFNLDNKIVMKKLTERYGSKIPYNEPVISPADIFNSDKLVTIYEN